MLERGTVSQSEKKRYENHLRKEKNKERGYCLVLGGIGITLSLCGFDEIVQMVTRKDIVVNEGEVFTYYDPTLMASPMQCVIFPLRPHCDQDVLITDTDYGWSFQTSEGYGLLHVFIREGSSASGGREYFIETSGPYTTLCEGPVSVCLPE